MAELNGKKYKDWRNYIADKFPEKIFHISIEEAGSNTTFTISDKRGISKTVFVIELVQDIACKVLFYHPDSPVNNKHNDVERKRAVMFVDYELNNENLDGTDNYIDIALYRGWTERTIFYKSKQLKSELLYYEDGIWKSIPLETNYWSWADKGGCLILLVAWPIMLVQSTIVENRIRNSKKNQIDSRSIPPVFHGASY